MGCSPTSPGLHLHKIVETCAYLELMNCDTSMKPTHETNENDFQKSLKGWSTGHIVFGCIWGVDTISNKAFPQKKTHTVLLENLQSYNPTASDMATRQILLLVLAPQPRLMPVLHPHARWKMTAAEKVKLWMSNMAIWIKIIGNIHCT